MNYKSIPTGRRAFLHTGLTMLVLAALNLANFIFNAVDGQFSFSTYADLADAQIVQIALIVVMSLGMISVLLRAFLGTKAVIEAQTPTKARYHIVIAKITFVFTVFSTIFAVLALFESNDMMNDVLTLLLHVAEAFLLVCYVVEGKKVRVQK